MKTWIVNPFDGLPPEGFRPMRYWLMAEAFAAAGHSVAYWTADFSHATKEPRVFAPDAAPPPFELIAVHEPRYVRNVGFRRLWAHWRWALNWRKAAEARIRAGDRPDLIVASSPPLAIGGEVRAVAAECGAKTVIDVMDAWPETFERVAPRWSLAPLRTLARRNYLCADAVTVVADAYAGLVRSYGFAGRVRRFYHGIALPAAPAPSAMRRAPGRLAVAYAGNLGRTYDLRTVVKAVAAIPGATLDVAGAGDGADGIAETATALGISDRVAFHGYLDDAALARMLDSCDVGVVPMDPASFVGIPYKLADYTSRGLAVASSLGGESGRLLAKYGAGVGYEAGNAKSLADALRRVAANLAKTRAAARRLAEREFDAKRIYSEYVSFACRLAR